MNPLITETKAREKLANDGKKQMSLRLFSRLVSEGHIPQPIVQEFESGSVRRYYRRTDIDRYIDKFSRVTPLRETR